MARSPQPWYWEERNSWYVTINGTRHNLGPEKKAAISQFHELMSRRTAAAPSGSVWSLLEEFLEWCQANRPASYSWYLAHLQRFKDGVPNCRIVDLQPAAIEAWLGSKATWGGTYKAGIVTAIKRVFNWAVKKRGLTYNPAIGLERPAVDGRDRVLSEEEYQSIYAAASDQAFRDLLFLAWKTGARPQELPKIEARHLQKNKTVVFPKAESKGRKRARVIFLTDECHAVVAKLAKRCPTGPILRNRDGTPWTAMAISCRFSRMADDLGFKPVLYWFRHSYIHHGLTKGKIDPMTMATLAGHADLTMIYKVYGHLLKNSDHMREAAQRAIAGGGASP